MEIDISVTGWAMLGMAALIFALVVQLIDDGRGYGWLATMGAAFVGAFLASESLSELSGLEPVRHGVAVVPALLGGPLMGGAADLTVRWMKTRGRSVHRPLT